MLEEDSTDDEWGFSHKNISIHKNLIQIIWHVTQRLCNSMKNAKIVFYVKFKQL